jgi:RHS repeat-associated protein
MKPHSTLPPARLPALLALITLLPLGAAAQDEEKSQYDRGTPPQHAAGLGPFGGYASADLGTVNLSNGSLNFSLPLGAVGGRGFSLPLTLNYSSKVWSASTGTDRVNEPILKTREARFAVYDAEEARPDFYQQVAPGWTVGAVPMLTAKGVGLSPAANNQCGASDFLQAVTKLSVTLPDKGEVELRDDLTDGSPLGAVPLPPSTCRTRDGDRGQRWHATDGSGIIFFSDAPNGVVNGDMNGWLVTPDGTRYRFEDTAPGFGGSVHINQSARATLVIDRHGNRVRIDYTVSPAQVAYTDQLGRRTIVEYNVADPQTGEPLAVMITLPGWGGGPLRYKIKTGLMNQNHRAGVSPTLPVYNGWVPGMAGDEFCGSAPAVATHLFQSWCGGAERIDDKQVLTQLVLPDDRSLRFRYNEYGEVAEVELPTGGRLQYDYAHEDSLPAGNSPDFETAGPPGNVRAIDRAIVARRTYPGGANAEAHWTYAYSAMMDANGGATGGVTEVVARAADDATVVLRRKHYFLDGGRYLTSNGGTGYSLWSTGRERRVETLNAAGTAALAASEQDWSQRAPVVWSHGYASEQIQNDNRVNEERKILDTGATARVGYTYDQYNNPTEVREYDYDNSLRRRTVTAYLSANNGLNYQTDDSIRLLRLPSRVTVYDGAGGRASETTFAYDEAAYPIETYGAVSGWSAPPSAARGNATTVSRLLDAPDSRIATHARYDQVGNVRYSWDAKGNRSEVSYADAYADGVARNTYAFPTENTSPVPDPSNVRATNTPLVTSAVYDYSTGLVSAATDANGRATRFEYDDPFNRPTRVERPDGGWTAYSYGRNAYGDYVRTRAAIDAAQSTDAYQYFDGLGRGVRSFRYDGARWITSDTQYDALGRAWRVSADLYPSDGTGSPLNPSGLWIETAFDALGRVTRVRTTADGAQVLTGYSGNSVTVTDQAGKSRTSVTDALGRLVRVVEDPAGAAHQTDYSYDALGNLRKVNQGGQTRYFMYDSLSRLVRARHPEQDVNGALAAADAFRAPEDPSPNGQWTLFYAYDANGNVVSRTDARGVTTTYRYDNINRLKQTEYSDGTPYTLLTYDFAANGRGRLYADYESSTQGTLNFVLAYDAAGRPASRRTDFYLNGTGWVGGYTSSRVYDLAGNVRKQTYPSGRAVEYTQFDAAGRLKRVTGSLGDGAARTYSTGFDPSGVETGIQYDAASRLTREAFGTETLLHHKRHYNARGQLYDVRVGSAPDEWNWNRGAVILYYDGQHQWQGSGPDNNGNLTRMQHWVPGDDAVTTYALSDQYFQYDALNRLKSVNEYQEGTSVSRGHAFAQGYDYDRWGNRRIDAAATWGAGVPAPQFTVDVATNRLNVPAGQAGAMQYDAAGNLVNDTYTGAGGRGYDAENRMTSAWGPGPGGGSYLNAYTYDAAGRRTRRRTQAGEVWHVYGFEGELLAEYTAAGAAPSPLKEYGYRAGELLVVAEAPAGQSAAVPPDPAQAVASETVAVAADAGPARRPGLLHPLSLFQLAHNVGLTVPAWLAPPAHVPVSDVSVPLLATPAAQAVAERIVFSSDRDGGLQIYSMQPDGGGASRLTHNPSNDDAPRWSPDGSRIAFQSDRDNSPEGAADIYVMSADGANQTRLTTDPADDGAPAWSPDGTRIAFQSRRGGPHYRIYVMNADGSNQVNLSNSAGNDTQPAWSPDGSRIAFASDRDAPGRPSVYVMNADGTNQTRLTNSPAPFRDEQPAWSPDGSRLAFVSTRDSLIDVWEERDEEGGAVTRSAVRTNKEVYLMNADGGGRLRLTNTPENDDSPQWSADGARVVFRSDRERECCDPTPQIWVTNPDGSGQANLSNHGLGDYSPHWRRNSTNLPPAVAITSPRTKDSFTAPAGITIKASASDADGHVAAVDFYHGATHIATDTAAPFEAFWNNVGPGTYYLTARAVDNSGAATTSAHVKISVVPAAPPPQATLRWIVSDHLGTPRMTVDQTGSLSSVRRHDYLPFGEELAAGTGGRTAQQGYASDNVRQKFAGSERDTETGLDFMQARYFASAQGRFSSPDPLLASGRAAMPQSWNRYAYVLNNPLRLVDPNGLEDRDPMKALQQQQPPQPTQPPQEQPPQQSVPVQNRIYSINCNGDPNTNIALPQPAQDALNQFSTAVANNRYDTMTVAYAIEQNPRISETTGINLSLNISSSGPSGGVSSPDTTTVRTPDEAVGNLTIANDRAAPFTQLNSTVMINPCTQTSQPLNQMEFQGGGNVAAALVRMARVNGNQAGDAAWRANYPQRQVPTPFRNYVLPNTFRVY